MVRNVICYSALGFGSFDVFDDLLHFGMLSCAGRLGNQWRVAFLEEKMISVLMTYSQLLQLQESSEARA
jgi:hypothetical protein